MSENPRSIRFPAEVTTEIESFMKKTNIKKFNKGVNELVIEGLKSANENVPNLNDITDREYELKNFLQMGAFLSIKEWQAIDHNGYTIIKTEELQRINEFITCFSDLTHNSSLWRERFADEGYTKYVEVIERARNFL